jgi:1-acyl-sn-glycerol-3-phosphate acyltransferase
MIGKIRLVVALSSVVASTLLLVPFQVLAMKTGWYSENLVLGLWHRIVVKALGLRIHQQGAMTEKRPLLIASNHISWTDIEVMASLFDVTFIARSDIDGWPVIGALCRLQRPVYVERGRKRKAGEQASDIAKRLAAGRPIVLFAEGSTGDGNMLLPFKSTLFGAAGMAIAEGVAEKVYIQPVALTYTRIQGIPMGRQHRPLVSWIGDAELVPNLKGLLSEGAIDVEVRFGEPVEFSAGSSRKEMTRAVEAQVYAMMQSALRDPLPSSAN